MVRLNALSFRRTQPMGYCCDGEPPMPNDDALLGMNASAPLPVTTRNPSRTALARDGAAKTLLNRDFIDHRRASQSACACSLATAGLRSATLGCRIQRLAPFKGFMRRNSTAKPVLAKGTRQISRQALQLKRVDGGECMIIYPACRGIGQNLKESGGAEWEDSTPPCMRD